MSLTKDGFSGEHPLYVYQGFWARHKKWCVVVAVLVVLSCFSWAFWSSRCAQQDIEAANFYSLMIRELDQGHTEHLADIVRHLQKEYPHHFFSVLASFRMARFEFGRHRLEETTPYLRWILAHGLQPWVDLARIRLANVLIDLHRYDEVAPLVVQKGTGYFAARFWMVAGDAAFMKKDGQRATFLYKKAQGILQQVPCDDTAFESTDRSLRRSLEEKLLAAGSIS